MKGKQSEGDEVIIHGLNTATTNTGRTSKVPPLPHLYQQQQIFSNPQLRTAIMIGDTYEASE